MKKVNTALVTIALLGASINTQAVSYSTDMDAADYKDYVVQIENANTGGICGSALVNGRFLITARHCVDADPLNYYVVPTEIDPINVWQTPYYHAPKTEGHTFTSDNPKPFFANNHLYYPLMTERMEWVDSLDGYDGGSVTSHEYFADFVVIELASEPVLNQSSATAFVEFIDFGGEEPSQAVNEGDTLTFFGWGVNEDGYSLDVGGLAQTATMTVPAELQRQITERTIELDDGSSYNYIKVDAAARTTFYFNGEARATGGDSGTPVTMGHKTVATAIDNGYAGESVGVVLYTGLLPFLAESINELSTVTQLKSTEQTGAWSFPVQNLTMETVTLEISASSEVISLSSDCDSEMVTGDHCIMEVSATAPDGEAVTGDITILYNGEQRIIPVLLNAEPEALIAAETPEEPTPEEPTPEEPASNSSGGSMGGTVLIGLALLAIGRKRYK